VPLLIAPHGGSLDGGLDTQRTFLTARSVEFDALLLAGSPPPAPDALASRDAKTGDPGEPSTVDPRVVMMIEECFRHSKAIGGWGSARIALDEAGCTTDDLGVIVSEDPSDVLNQVMKLLGSHRVWDRFHPTVP